MPRIFTESDTTMRPQVKKYHQQFLGYVEKYGAAVVKDCLINRRNKTVRMAVSFNGKDRREMISVLGL